MTCQLQSLIHYVYVCLLIIKLYIPQIFVNDLFQEING